MDENKEHDRVISVRLPEKMIRELEELRPLLRQLPEYQASSLSRSALMRVAIAHGLIHMRSLLKNRLPESEQVDLLSSRQEKIITKTKG